MRCSRSNASFRGSDEIRRTFRCLAGNDADRYKIEKLKKMHQHGCDKKLWGGVQGARMFILTRRLSRIGPPAAAASFWAMVRPLVGAVGAGFLHRGVYANEVQVTKNPFQRLRRSFELNFCVRKFFKNISLVCSRSFKPKASTQLELQSQFLQLLRIRAVLNIRSDTGIVHVHVGPTCS